MRRNVAIVLALVVVVAMCIAIWRYVRNTREGNRLVLAEVRGQVSLQGPGRDGTATSGTELRPEDLVRTEAAGRAVLELDGGSRVRIGPSSSVVIDAVDATGVSLDLEGGALKATVRPESGPLSVNGAGMTVQATDADFDLGIDPTVSELMVVEASRGEVAVMGADVARIAAGSRAVIRDRKAAVGPIPDDLLLSVAWPEPTRTRKEKTLVSGQTAPGARVQLSGGFGELVLHADDKGNFEAVVPLVEGRNELMVRAFDLLGDRADVQGLLQTRDTRGPTFNGGVEYGP